MMTAEGKKKLLKLAKRLVAALEEDIECDIIHTSKYVGWRKRVDALVENILVAWLKG